MGMDLEKELGRPLTPSELAHILGVSPNSIRKNFLRWGGVEVFPGTIRFYENIVKEKICGNFSQEIRQGTSLEGGRDRKRQAARTDLRRQLETVPKGRNVLGGTNTNRAPAADVTADPHGLLSDPA